MALKIDRWRGPTLYLDALDEMRGRSDDSRTVLDQARGRLDELGCPRFRLSCRAADWYGSADADRLADVSPDRTLAILEMEPLDEAEISEIVSSRGMEPKAFVDEARNRGVYELLQNPQTLLMVLSVVRQGSWPDTRSALFGKATEILVREVNEEHRRAWSMDLPVEELLLAAGRLSAVVLCSGAEGLALDESAEGEGFLPIRQLGQPMEVFSVVARRRLFRAQGPERVVPVHRTVAEYLAARYLCDRIREGLPRKRVLALITGHDGGTLSDLRGVYAWLACTCLQHADVLIPIDPLGVVLYGDVSMLPPSGKKRVLDSLVDLAQRNPWFRSENWAPKPFGALAVPEMEPSFRDVLSDRNQQPVPVSCVLHAVAHGAPMPSLGDLLLDLVRDDARFEYLRVDALEAFERACPERKDALRTLLDDIHEGRVADGNCRLRGGLLRRLYPSDIRPADVVRYLVDDPEHFIGEYAMWVGYELVSCTDPADLPTLLDAAVEADVEVDRIRRHSWQRFVGLLLSECLSRYGETVTPERLYRWLGASLDQHDTMMLEKEHANQVRAWLEGHPDKVREVFSYWLLSTDPEDLPGAGFRLCKRLLRIDWPDGFGHWLLDRAAEEADDRVACFLFREGVRLRTMHDRPDAPGLEDLLAFVEQHERFAELLQAELVCDMADWRWKGAKHTAERRQARESAKKEHVRWLLAHLDEVRSGRHSGALTMLAQAHFGMFIDVDRDLDPRGRIASITNAECAEAAHEGFIAVLREHQEAPTVALISAAHAKSRHYRFGWVVLAGMDLLSKHSMDEVLRLPGPVLESALAYHFRMGTGEEREWVRVLLSQRPDTASGVLETFWRALLAGKCEHVEGLYALARDDSMAEVARRLVLPLLREFPNSRGRHLEHLLKAALVHVDDAELLDLARDTIGRANAVRGEQRVLWFACAFLLSPAEFNERVRRYLGKDAEKTGRFLSFLSPGRSDDRGLRPRTLTLAAVADLVSICGRIFVPGDREELEGDDGEWTSQRDLAHTVRGLIDRLAADSSEGATDLLRALSADKALTPWRDHLAHALSVQTRKRREAAFRYPSAKDVADTLDGGSPANPADLQALVVQHLGALQDDIADGSTDGYKVFWNVDSYGRPDTPKPEETCRDHLLDRLRERLSPLGLAAEPEGHFARDKRADIKVLFQDRMVLPVEIKRHYHRDLWTAPLDQLKALYARDPATGGRGVYLVFQQFPAEPENGRVKFSEKAFSGG